MSKNPWQLDGDPNRRTYIVTITETIVKTRTIHVDFPAKNAGNNSFNQYVSEAIAKLMNCDIDKLPQEFGETKIHKKFEVLSSAWYELDKEKPFVLRLKKS